MEEVEPFITDCKIYIQTKRSEFQGEQDQMMWVFSYCSEGTARDWHEVEMECMNANGSVFPYTMVHKLFEELRT